MKLELYVYKAKVIDAYDGDTITCEIMLGMNVSITENLRLKNINAPEVRGEERESGLISRDALREKILGKEIYLVTEKDKTGKYGRFVATIWLADDAIINETNGDSSVDIAYVNINDWLVENKYAERREYKI